MTNFQLTISTDNSADIAHISALSDVMCNGSEAELNVDDLIGAIRRLASRAETYAKWRAYQNKDEELVNVSASLRSLADKIDKG